MSLPVTTIWEVRPTIGSDTAGGAFDPAIAGAGTDYSQQNAPNSTGNNKSTTDGVGTGSTTINSATASFTSAIVGNIVYFDTQWYEVTAFTDSANVVVERATTSGTGLVLNIGGALATISQFIINIGTSISGLPGNTCYVKNTGNYVTTTTQVIGSSIVGHVTTFIGYGTTRGDSVRVVWTTSTNSINLINHYNCTNIRMDNFEFSSTAGTPGDGVHALYNGYDICFVNCQFTGFAAGVNGNYNVDYTYPRLSLIGCEINNNNIGLINCGISSIIASHIHNNTTIGVELVDGQSGQFLISHSVIRANGTYGVRWNSSDNSQFSILNSAIIDNVSDGYYVSQTNNGPLISINNIWDSNGGYGINVVSGAGWQTLLVNNAFRNNTSGKYTGLFPSNGVGEIILTADPFTNRSTGDFTLNSTAGGGPLLVSTGYPTIIP